MSDKLIADYADLGVSCGYIGNLERWGDDRSFRVFTKLSDRYGADACNQSIHVSKGPDGTVEYDTPETRRRLDAIRAAFAQGKLHKVGSW